jgi:CDP-diacylglycerol--glycerol-3-phosphate 3-phosphatidyltransferase
MTFNCMSTTTQTTSAWNVPNTITAVRLVLAVAVITLIPLKAYLVAVIVFLVAASTDWIDGYWARKYGQVTKVGRVFDPFVDKIIVCGTFIALAEAPGTHIVSWMATIVVGRELLVTSLRSMVEGAGGDFSANWLGKWKMVFQCAAAVSELLCLIANPVPNWLTIVSTAIVWLAVFLTVYSGYAYVQAAATVLRGSDKDASAG